MILPGSANIFSQAIKLLEVNKSRALAYRGNTNQSLSLG